MRVNKGYINSTSLNHQYIMRMYLWWNLYASYLHACQSQSCRRAWLRSLLLYLCYVFRALINSLVCWFNIFLRGKKKKDSLGLIHLNGQHVVQKDAFWSHIPRTLITGTYVNHTWRWPGWFSSNYAGPRENLRRPHLTQGKGEQRAWNMKWLQWCMREF